MTTVFESLVNRPVSQQWVQRIVRSLGCQCPDEIFKRIRRRSLSGDQPEIVLEIGGRLLLALISSTRLDEGEALLQTGQGRRDALGLQRFRLVFVGDVDSAALDGLATTAGLLDERVHVHALPEAALED